MTGRTSHREWLIFGALGLFWGSSYLFIKIGVETLTPFTLVAGRLLVGSLLLGVVLRASGESLPRDRRTYRHLVVMAILNIVIPFSLITSGEQTIDSASPRSSTRPCRCSRSCSPPSSSPTSRSP